MWCVWFPFRCAKSHNKVSAGCVISDHNTKWFKSVLALSQGPKHKSSCLPHRQGSLPKNKGTSGNNFLRRICHCGSEIHSSSKTPLFQKKSWPRKFFSQNFARNFFRRRKMKNCKLSETRFPKVSRRSEPCSRGKRSFEVSKKKSKLASWLSKR